MINPSVFQQIQQLMGPLQIDIFVSPASTAGGQTQARDYANPPWCLISSCLSQIKRQQARVVLVTPLWPYQPWFPLLLKMPEDYLHKLPSIPDLLLNPTNQEFIMKQGVPKLVAWPTSGNLLLHEEFLHRLQTCCSPHGETKPINYIFYRSSNGISIPLLTPTSPLCKL